MAEEFYTDTSHRLGRGEQTELIQECQKHIGAWYGYFSQNIRSFREDKFFYHGDQWPGWALKSLQEEEIPAIVTNLIKPIVRILTGSIQQLDPQLTMVPLNSNKYNPEELAAYIDIIRAIAYSSKSSLAYSTTVENMLTGGWGVCEVGTRYVDNKSFNQEVFIRGHREPQQIFFDPNASEITKSDSAYQGSYKGMSEEEFKATYPDADYYESGSIIAGIVDHDWVAKNGIVVAKYYVRDKKNKKLVALSNGQGFTIEILSEEVKETLDNYYKRYSKIGVPQLSIPPLIEINSRQTQIDSIMCYEMNGTQVLKSYEWISKYMPYVFFDCNSGFRDGRQYTESFIYNAKDAQRIYNFCWSQAIYATEALRKERIFATPLQARGFEKLYKYPQKALGYMPYNPDPMVGGPPIISPPAEISSTYFKAAEIAAYDIQRALGVFEPSQGQLVSDASGVANMTAMLQSNVALKPVVGNLFVGMEQVGRICMDVVPKLYDTERLVPTQNESGSISTVTINEHIGSDEYGEPVYKNDISKISMELQIKPGASFEAQKMVEDQKLMQVLSLNPEFATSGGDLMASRIATPAGYTLSKRLSAFVPPVAKAAEEGKDPPPPPPNPMEQAQLATMQAQSQKLQAEAMAKMEEVKLEQQKLIQQQQDFELRQQETMSKFYETIMKANAEVHKTNSEIEISHMEKAIDLHKFHSGQEHESRMSEKQSRKKSKGNQGA